MLPRFAAASFAALMLTPIPLAVSAQNYPDKAIRLVVPFPPGGPTDVAGRIVSEYLSQKFGQPVVIENKPGAGSQLGIDLVAKSKPDGYTFVLAGTDGISMLPAVKQSIPYRLPADFTFIGSVAKSTIVLAVSAKLPYRSIAELVAFGKANPGKLRYGTIGVGTGGHLSTEVIGKIAGLQMVHVPHTGTAPNVQALVGGFIDFSVSGGSTMKPQADAGTIRVLATIDKERHKLFPDVPTLAEAGIPDVNTPLYIGILGPAGIPQDIVERWKKEMAGMIADPAVSQKISNVGLDPVYLGGDDFKTYMVKDFERWRDVAKSANIVIQE
jgi:tripartite-type tricarboxylate transporter receptor subunit TctC